jgi:dTDP-4-amino-4,6-dideoxygalactose transaminase
MKHRMAPLSAAIARVQLRHAAARSKRRIENLEYLSRRLEPLGLNTFLPPPGIQRVYFLFLVHNDEERTGLTTDTLVAALRAEGCDVFGPRYPLLHQQPVFVEDKFIEISRLSHLPREQLPVYRAEDLPRTTAANARLLQLPSFPNADRNYLDQYARAFEKVLGSAVEIRAAHPAG